LISFSFKLVRSLIGSGVASVRKSERMKLEPHRIGHKRPARQPLIAPLPSLIHCSHVPHSL